MKKHSLALLASLLGVVFLSGCTLPGISVGRGAAAGVIIKRFAPDISEIYSGDEVVFSLTVENVGGEDATDVEARLFGLGTEWTYEDGKKQEIDDLERSQPEYKVPGGIGDAQWIMESPSDLKVDNTYTAVVRLTYSYGTTALANAKIYSSDYLQTNPEEAEKIMKSSGIESFTVTDAPITVELAGVARPYVHRGEGTQQASLTFLISNIGQGKPFRVNEDDMEIHIESITVPGDCLNWGDLDKNPRLPRAGKKSIPCKFNLPTVAEYTTIPIGIELSYEYFLDDTTSIKVLRSLFVD